jgi:hypothetical protein
VEYPTLLNPAVQPPLFGPDADSEPRGTTAPALVSPIALETGAARHERLARAAGDRQPRRRYWSIRDLARRIWLGRGYELLRGLIRAEILPATRSSRTWWVADADVRGLLAAFEPQAGKVRAFRRLDAWLSERCWVTPLTPPADAAVRDPQGGFAWRGHAYLPKATWTSDTAPVGERTFRHRDGTSLAERAEHEHAEGTVVAIAPDTAVAA